MPSHMLSRVKRPRRGAGLRIPRKGRIRVALIVVLALTAWRMTSQRKAEEEVSITSSAVETSSAKKTRLLTVRRTRKPSKKTVNQLPKPQASVGAKMDESELVRVLKENPHLLSGSSRPVPLRKQVLRVHTTIDSGLQSLGTKLMSHYRPRYGALLAMEPATGRILTMVSYTHDTVPSLGENLCLRSVFPAASIFKTVTAAAALESGHLMPESCLPIAGQRHTLYHFQLRKELNTRDEVSLEESFAYSINPVFARIGLYLLRPGELSTHAQSFGFTHHVPFIFPVDTSQVMQADSTFPIAELASGFNRVTSLSPLLGALMASAIVEHGRMPLPILVDSVSDTLTGRKIYQKKQGLWKTAVKPETATHLRRLMTRVPQYGTARNSFRYVKQTQHFRTAEYGGKTGSINKEGLGKVDWFVGYVRHPEDPVQRLAVSVVTTHGEYWTVHSSFIAAEILRNYIRSLQIEAKQQPMMVESVSDTLPPGGG